MCTLRQRNGRIYTIRRLKGFDELNVFCKCDYMPCLRYDATASTLTDKNLLRFLLNYYAFLVLRLYCVYTITEWFAVSVLLRLRTIKPR
jgi:hypothetical protein